MVHFKQEDLVYLERIKDQKIVKLLNWLKANFKMKWAMKGVQKLKTIQKEIV